MKTAVLKPDSPLDSSLIAPCGIDCGVCLAHRREKKPCPGCLMGSLGHDPHPKCTIRACARDQGFVRCFECRMLPCQRMKNLDKVYRTNYGTSLILNSRFIRENGLEAFVEQEAIRWDCPACHQLLSIHSPACPSCGQANRWYAKKPKTAQNKSGL
jgi:hypothetical protein